MSQTGIIRTRDRRPLGTAKEVRDRLGAAFPGSRFVLEGGEPDALPGRSSVAAFLMPWKARYPSWRGFFQADDFAVEFDLGAALTVKTVRVVLHGRVPEAAQGYFARLFEDTGWKVEF